MENFKEKTYNLKFFYCRKWDSKERLFYYKAKARKLEADRAKKKKKNLEDLKEQVKFFENEKLLLKEQLDLSVL